MSGLNQEHPIAKLIQAIEDQQNNAESTDPKAIIAKSLKSCVDVEEDLFNKTFPLLSKYQIKYDELRGYFIEKYHSTNYPKFSSNSGVEYSNIEDQVMLVGFFGMKSKIEIIEKDIEYIEQNIEKFQQKIEYPAFSKEIDDLHSHLKDKKQAIANAISDFEKSCGYKQNNELYKADKLSLNPIIELKINKLLGDYQAKADTSEQEKTKLNEEIGIEGRYIQYYSKGNEGDIAIARENIEFYKQKVEKINKNLNNNPVYRYSSGKFSAEDNKELEADIMQVQNNIKILKIFHSLNDNLQKVISENDAKSPDKNVNFITTLIKILRDFAELLLPSLKNDRLNAENLIKTAEEILSLDKLKDKLSNLMQKPQEIIDKTNEQKPSIKEIVDTIGKFLTNAGVKEIDQSHSNSYNEQLAETAMGFNKGTKNSGRSF